MADLVREFRMLLPDLASSGAVSLSAYEGKLIREEVVTVGEDGLGQELSTGNRYSRIKRLIEIRPDDYGELYEALSDGIQEQIDRKFEEKLRRQGAAAPNRPTGAT